MADIMSKGKEVISEIREEMPVVREAISEIRTEPQNALSKIIQVCKDIWAKIVEVGLIGAIVQQVKGMISSATSNSSSRGAVSIPESTTTDPEAPIVGTPAADTPLLSGN